MYEKDLAAKDTKVFSYGKLNQLRIRNYEFGIFALRW